VRPLVRFSTFGFYGSKFTNREFFGDTRGIFTRLPPYRFLVQRYVHAPTDLMDGSRPSGKPYDVPTKCSSHTSNQDFLVPKFAQKYIRGIFGSQPRNRIVRAIWFLTRLPMGYGSRPSALLPGSDLESGGKCHTHDFSSKNRPEFHSRDFPELSIFWTIIKIYYNGSRFM
jgi:hypothetical protein